MPFGLSCHNKVTANALANLNRNVDTNAQTAAGLDNLYQRDKDKIAQGFEITRQLAQNANTFMNYMAKDLDAARAEKAALQTQSQAQGNAPILAPDGTQATLADGTPLTIKDLNDPAFNAAIAANPQLGQARDAYNQTNQDLAKAEKAYDSRQALWGSGGYGSMLVTGLVGAASGNVTGSGAALLQNSAINVVRQLGAQQIKGIADGFMDNGKPTDKSELIRGALHAIAGCAGASATGGDCASAATSSAATVGLNNLVGLNPNDMTAEQKQAYSNLMGTLVAGVASGVGGDAAAAQLASKIEVENNLLSAQNFDRFLQAISSSDSKYEKVLALIEQSKANDRRLDAIYEKYLDGTPLSTSDKRFLDTLAMNTAGAASYTVAAVNKLLSEHPEYDDKTAANIRLLGARLNSETELKKLSVLRARNSVDYNPDAHKAPYTAEDAKAEYARVNMNQHPADPNSKAYKDNESLKKVPVRFGGAVGVVAGAASTVATGAATVVSAADCALGTKIGCATAVGAGLLTGQGFDYTIASAKTFWTGEYATPYGEQALKNAGLTENQAAWTYAGAGVAGGVVTSSIPRIANNIERGAAAQATQRFNEAYARAPAAKIEIDVLADTIASKYNGSVAKAPVKSSERALEKINNEYFGDASKIKDLARNTIIVNEQDIQKVASELSRAGAKTKFITADVDELGYSGVNTVIKTNTGITAEVQVNSPQMIYAKESESVARSILGDVKYNEISQKTGVVGGQGHLFYEQWRTLNKSSQEARQIAEKSRSYYNSIRSAF